MDMDSYQTSYVDRNKDIEIQTYLSETQNILIDERKTFLVMSNNLKQTKYFSLFTTVQELYRIFTTSSAPLFTVFTGFLKNDQIDLEDQRKQPPRGVLRKRCFENVQQNYRRTLMPRCQ